MRQISSMFPALPTVSSNLFRRVSSATVSVIMLTLNSYLSFVDLGGSTDQGVIARYIQAQQDLANAQAGVNKALTSALSDWQNQKAAGLTTSDFPSWASSNAALYNNAVIVYQGVAGAFKNRVADMNGELAPQYNQDTDRINSALYSQTPISGYVRITECLCLG
jgi:hypothetical protein